MDDIGGFVPGSGALYEERLTLSPQPLTSGVASTIVARCVAAGSLVLRGLLTCVLVGFMMADHAARSSPQYPVMTGDVARDPTNRCTL